MYICPEGRLIFGCYSSKGFDRLDLWKDVLFFAVKRRSLDALVGLVFRLTLGLCRPSIMIVSALSIASSRFNS